MVSVPRVNKILEHPLFKEYTSKNALAEEQRVFCRHGFDHGLAVARIAYIFLLEEGRTTLPKEVVYASAVLHDLGRWLEYEKGEDHALLGAELGKPILIECGFDSKEVDIISQGIREHRLNPEGDLSLLGKALAYADDWARDCRSCASKATCYKYSPGMDEIIA